MAITPHEARQQELARMTPTIVAWEAELDKGLAEGKRTFPVSGQARCASVSEIQKRYEVAGWNVRSFTDRNEMYLTFTARQVRAGDWR